MNIYEYKYNKYKSKYIKLKGGNNDIKKALDSLLNSNSKWYSVARIGLTNDDEKIFKNIKIMEKTYSFYGIISKIEQEKYISDFIKSMDNTDEHSNKVANIILSKLVIPFLNACKMNSCWITIRATEPTDYFDIHRWHCDGYYYKPEEMSNGNKNSFKIITSLRGPGTLFKKENNDIKNLMYELEDKMLLELNNLLTDVNRTDMNKIKEIQRKTQNKYKSEISQALDKFPTEQTTFNEALIFISGNKERCLIHSEPPMHEDRLFISIVPGNYDDIVDMVKFRKEEINVPIYI